MEETTIPHIVVDAEDDPETNLCASDRLLAELSDAERMAPRLRHTTAVLGQLSCPLRVDNEGCIDLRPSTGHAVSDTVDTLILDLLAWMARPRPYAEVLEAWRTSCPRLPVWEDANDDRGFIVRHRAPGRGVLVSVSAAGAEYLRKHRRPSPR